jgi:cyclohexanone monooxygenase
MTTLDALIVGAGFAGMHSLYKLRSQGLTVRVLEAGDGVGGTWFWNRYPGARVDIQSLEYSYQFDEGLQQEWTWSEKYAPQPELEKYANHVADRFNLRPDIQLNTRVAAARFNEADNTWAVTTEAGETFVARNLIMATGCLSSFNIPDYPGLDGFKGRVFHTGAWPKDPVDFSGRRVGIIGTGSSAIQTISEIAPQTAQLTVFQRTANYSVPAQNGPLPDDVVAEVKAHYREYREANYHTAFSADFGYREVGAFEVSDAEREAEYERRWARGGLTFYGAFNDLVSNFEANKTLGDFLRKKIRQIVKDPKTAELLCPDYPVGCKRLCVDTGYYATYNLPQVSLVDIKSAPIQEILPNGLRTADATYEFDDLILATGFDAMTGALMRIDITGRDGLKLKDHWAAGPRNYLGLSVAGFPNMFIITGPGSPSVFTNMLPSIEHHVNWIGDALAWMNSRQVRRLEATPEAEAAWIGEVNAIADATVLQSCNSWYVGANIPGKPRVFMPYLGVPPYIEKCSAVAAHDYEGFLAA